jgi:replicative DNA helicase
MSSALSVDDFHLKDHKDIFKACLELFNADNALSEEFIISYLKEKKIFKEDVIVEIMTTTPLPLSQGYIDELKKYTKRRKLLHISHKINQGLNDYDDTNELVEDIERELYKISIESTQKDFRDATDIVRSTLEYIKEMKSREGEVISGLDTGFDMLNSKTSGFGKGDLIIIAARPSMGKTAFALNIASSLLSNRKGVAIFSLEMPAEQLMLRMISSRTSLPLQDLRIGNLNDFQWSNVLNVMNEFEKNSLFVDDDGNLSISLLRKKIRKLKARHPEISMIIIDYLQLMASKSNKDRHQEVADISRGLKLLARELDIPIIALSQLNRSLESRPDKRPMMSDIRESGAIEQDADLILFVYRDDVYKIREEREKAQKNKDYKMTIEEKEVEEAEIIIGKNRNGPTGIVNLLFHKKHIKFLDKSRGETYNEVKSNFDMSSVNGFSSI